MNSSDILGLGIGFLTGDAIADSLVDDDNTLGKVAVGFVSGGIAAKMTKDIVEETGIGDVLDDIFGF